MKKIKKVPVLESFKYGFVETKKHFKKLLPLSALFFLPDLLHKLGWNGRAETLFHEVYQVAVFFFLLILAMRLTQPKQEASDHQKDGLEFAKGNLLKWSAMLLAFALGGSLLLLAYIYTASPALALFNNAGLWEGAKAYGIWLWARPWPELALTAALLGYLPYRVFVMFNFFGYIIVDTGASALDSLKAARALAEGAFWGLSLFYAACGAMHFLGFSLYVVGAIFTFPITVLATVYVYRSLAEQQKGWA